MILGVALGRWLKVERTPAMLISVGTAICGGSAIAAVGPVVGANEEEMSVSLGAVFILNSIALLVFPLIGHGFGLSEEQFGLWSALAIHDTSSVVGATAKYGAAALAVGATIRTWLPAGKEAFDIFTEVARVGLTATLFLIGCGISKKTLRTVGARPLAQGVILWVIVGALSLALIRVGVIGL